MPGVRKVSIIISISDHSKLPEIVAALANQKDVDVEFETIAIASNGLRELPDLKQKIAPDDRRRCQLQCHSIASGGRGAALNEGIRLATGELYVFLADDFIPTMSWLSEHVALHSSHEALDIVGIGPALFPPHLANNRFSRWLDETGTIFGANFSAADSEGIPSEWFHGANTSLKPSLIWRAGLFDGDFPQDAGDDYELRMRLSQLGMQVVYLPDALAFHDHVVTLEDRMRQCVVGGASIALAEAKYSFSNSLPQQSLRWKLFSSKLKSRAWNAFRILSGSEKVEERYWKECLTKSHLEGYSNALKEIRRVGTPQRRLSTVIKNWMEDAIQKGVMSWDANMDHSKGLYPFYQEDGQICSAKSYETTCLQVKNSHGTPWAYFRVDPFFTQYLNNSIEVTCRIKTPRSTKVWIEYDSSDSGVEVVAGQPGAFKRTRHQRVSEAWSTCNFRLPDLTCQQRINGGDFRIGCLLEDGEGFQIQSVQVRRLKSQSPTSVQPFGWLEQVGFLPEDAPRVSIIIPVHNHLLYTLQCLQSIAMHSSQTTYEVIVVDDASTDETEEVVANVPGLRFARLGENLGFTGACNHGAEIARGELLLFLNNDTVAMTGWLDEMVAAFDSHPDAGTIGSRLVYPQTGKIQHIGVGIDDRMIPYHFVDPRYEGISRTDRTCAVRAVTGACLLTPSRLFNRLQRFDPIYESDCQDIDYCMKVEAAGLRSYCCGRSVVLHYESVTRQEYDVDLPEDLKRLQKKWTQRFKAA